MKRFWQDARAVELGDGHEGGWGVELDAKPLRTPAKATLALSGEKLARAIAAEWAAAGETFEPREMPLTGLANAAIDRVAADRAGFAKGLARYAEADLFCYRAEGPPKLVERQAEAWDRLIEWARGRYQIGFALTDGIRHIAQPVETVERLAQAVAQQGAFALAGLSPLVTIGGSLVAALAVIEQAVEPEAAWDAVSVDEAWQIETWGDDAEAVAMMAGRRRDWMDAARFLALV